MNGNPFDGQDGPAQGSVLSLLSFLNMSAHLVCCLAGTHHDEQERLISFPTSQCCMLMGMCGTCP